MKTGEQLLKHCTQTKMVRLSPNKINNLHIQNSSRQLTKRSPLKNPKPNKKVTNSRSARYSLTSSMNMDSLYGKTTLQRPKKPTKSGISMPMGTSQMRRIMCTRQPSSGVRTIVAESQVPIDGDECSSRFATDPHPQTLQTHTKGF